MMLAANIFVHLLCMNCSKYFIHRNASYPHTKTKKWVPLPWFPLTEEENEVRRWIKGILHLAGEMIKTVDLEVTIIRNVDAHLLVIKPKSESL